MPYGLLKPLIWLDSYENIVPKSESEYVQARDAGFRLAEIMVAKGAQEILKAAKNEVHKLREN